MALVKFFREDISSVPLSNKRLIKSFIKQLFEEEQKNVSSLAYIFTTDNYLLLLNQKHLNHNSLTDVITFNLSESKEEIIGEVYISVERVKDNAAVFKVALYQELLRVILHAALHLCGYRDKKKSEITLMRQKEEHYLRLFNEQSKNRST